MSRPPSAVCGLFPAFDERIGGVETSGRLAWEAIVAGAGRPAVLFCYPPGGGLGGGRTGGEGGRGGRWLRAGLGTLRARRHAISTVVVWHLGLLKLLPLLPPATERVALFLHGIEAWKPQGFLTRALMRRVGLILTNSRHTWERFLVANPQWAGVRHRTVHLGLGTPLARPVPPPTNPPAVLMVSRLLGAEDYKGHRELIGTWSRVLGRMPEAELWIAGDGDLRGDLERLAAATGVSHRVRFLGRVSEAEKQHLLTHCRCLAMPSHGEGFGLVYLEAMRMGRPCLTGRADAGREVINPPEAGLAVEPDDADQLTEAVLRLVSPGPEWDGWSVRARRRYKRYFTAAHFRQRLLEALFPERTTISPDPLTAGMRATPS